MFEWIWGYERGGKLNWPLVEELQEDDGRRELRWTRWRLLLSASSIVAWKAKVFSKEEKKKKKTVTEEKRREDIWMAMERGKRRG